MKIFKMILITIMMMGISYAPAMNNGGYTNPFRIKMDSDAKLAQEIHDAEIARELDRTLNKQPQKKKRNAPTFKKNIKVPAKRVPGKKITAIKKSPVKKRQPITQPKIQNNDTITNFFTPEQINTDSDAELAKELDRQLNGPRTQQQKKQNAGSVKKPFTAPVKKVPVKKQPIIKPTTHNNASTFEDIQIDKDAELAKKLDQQLNGSAAKRLTRRHSATIKRPIRKFVKKPVTRPAKGISYVQAYKNALAKGYYDLPQSLQAKRIIHLPANVQQNATCGYHTLINARAVETLVAEGKEITAANIIEKNKKMVTQYKIETSRLGLMQDNKISEWTTKLNLPHVYITKAIKSQTQIISDATYKNLKIRDIPLFRNQIQELLTSQEPMALHLACHTGTHGSGHWTYIGIIKEKDKQPRLIHLNSTRSTLENYKEMVALIEHIYTFIA